MASSAPRRRHSAAVYRRRRLVVVLLAVLVVAAIAWLLVAQPWKTAAAEQDAAPPPSAPATPASTQTSPHPQMSPAPTPTPAETPAAAPSDPTPAASPSLTPAAEPCRAGDLEVQAVTDQDTYASDQNPQLSITLTNKGVKGCTLNVGTSTQKFTIKSGDDVWWRSTDCQTEPSDMIVLLAAGQAVTSATPIGWDRTRSSVDSCTSPDRQRAPGGGASYHLSVEIGGVSAPQSTQFLLY